MPTLLQIDSCLGIRSTGAISENIAKEAMARGWKCYIIHGARFIGTSVQKHFKVSSRGIEYLHYAESLLLDRHGLGSRIATKRIIKKIRKIRPDIIQLHCIHGYYINYKILFNFLNTTNIPVVWTFHDCWAFTGHCTHFERINCTKWKHKCFSCELNNDYPKSLFIDRSQKNFQLKKELFTGIKNLTIIPVSNWLRDLVKQSFMKNSSMQVIYNGIDTDIFKNRVSNLREQLGLENKTVLIAAATTWSEGKGLSDYVRLSSQLSNQYKIVLVGLTEEQASTLSTNILSLPSTNNLIELAELYSMADISLNLSYQETFGLTTIEAMACGTPGIVYNKTASPELVDENTGVVVTAGDINGIVKAVILITQKGKNYYSEACRHRVMENFDRNDRYRDYVDLYGKLITINKNGLQKN